MTTIKKPKCHSIIVTGKVQDIGFRSIVEHIGRKLDKANFLLKSGFNNLNTDLNTGFDKMTDMLGTFIVGQHDHNTRLEAILEKLVDKA